MTPLDTFKAGIKTAIVTLLMGAIAVFTTLLSSFADWMNEGTAIDWSNARAMTFVLVTAAVVGAGNTAMRYAQVAGPAFIAKGISYVLGAVPVYPEPATEKVVTP